VASSEAVPGRVNSLHLDGERIENNAVCNTLSVSIGDKVAEGRAVPIKRAFPLIRVIASLPSFHPSPSSFSPSSPLMPLTRQKLRRIDLGNTRILRSGGHPRAPPVSRCHVRRKGQVSRKDAPRSLVPVIPGHLDGVTASEQSLRPEAEGNDPALDVLGRLHMTSRIRHQPLSLQHLDPPEEDDPSLLNGCRNVTTSRNTIITPEASPAVIAQSLLSDTVDLTNIGAPTDGTWEIFAAHEQRFCFEHGEVEWLIEYADRWMYPTNFEVDEAEAKLDAKFEQYQRGPEVLTPYRYASRAECNSSLWSQVETPTQRNTAEDTVAYRIRWKLFWTPQSSVDDLDFVQSSYKAQNERLGRRQSARVQDTAAASAAKREEMRIVVDLEKWI
jgi:hypothetical protein